MLSECRGVRQRETRRVLASGTMAHRRHGRGMAPPRPAWCGTRACRSRSRWGRGAIGALGRMPRPALGMAMAPLDTGTRVA